ncbi:MULTISPECIES: hypothetical protein [unclassified Microcoleus]|uniref:hypothetical protein n=1 Tax=unclassified Microcoleus TaxID=2642155 RepID=UPI002FD79747
MKYPVPRAQKCLRWSANIRIVIIVGGFGQDLGWSLVSCSSRIAVGNTCYRNTVFLGMPHRNI